MKRIDIYSKDKAKSLISPPVLPPDGFVQKSFLFNSEAFSQWLGLEWLTQFQSHSDWESSHPILIGSWARGEACPQSDIDLIFVGEENAVSRLVLDFQQKGLKIRSRIPVNLNDWTEGVKGTDVLALLKAKPITQKSAKELFHQQQLIWKNIKKWQKVFRKEILAERKARRSRYNSISNYLEPNLKYGPGGLRDIEQALQWSEVFVEEIHEDSIHAIQVLNYYKKFWLTLRQKLHLEGHQDTLVSYAQWEMYSWMGFQSHSDFMKEVQRGLSRVDFYANWIFESVENSRRKNKKIFLQHNFQKMDDLVKGLELDSSLMMQKIVRSKIDSLCLPLVIQKKARIRGVWLRKFIASTSSEEILLALFHSRLIDKIVPEFQRLVGLTQHDQYHRYTVDTHILQALRELKKIVKNPKLLGSMSFVVSSFEPKDFEILELALFFHDIGKGLDGDHSVEGEKITKKILKDFKIESQLAVEVTWLVRHHLEISKAALKKNPHSQKTLDELFEIGVTGKRIRRLALLTCVDIIATNPEAWNSWKSQLIRDLVLNLESESVLLDWKFHKLLKSKKFQKFEHDFSNFDSLLFGQLGESVLIDFIKLNKIKISNLKVLKKGKNIWVRVYEPCDQKGLFLKYVNLLHSFGFSIQQASVNTIAGQVYDWFQIRTMKSPSQVEKILNKSLKLDLKVTPKAVKFDDIYWIQKDNQEWRIGFKGKDQSGFLLEAVRKIYDSGLGIISAKVLTWGQQAEDIFRVSPIETDENYLEIIKNI